MNEDRMNIELIRDTQRHAKLAARAVQDALAKLAGKLPPNLDEIRLLMIRCSRATADTLETIGQPDAQATEKLSEDHVKAVNGMRRALAKAKGENALLRERTDQIVTTFRTLLTAQSHYYAALANQKNADPAHADMMTAWTS